MFKDVHLKLNVEPAVAYQAKGKFLQVHQWVLRGSLHDSNETPTLLGCSQDSNGCFLKNS